MQPEERDPLHASAVAVALGLQSPFLLFQDALAQQPDLGDVIYRYFGGENDADAEFPTHLVEETVQKIDPAFALSSRASELIAMSLLEDECLVLLSGKGTPRRLLKALRQVDRTFSRPSWVGDFFRASYGVPVDVVASTPGFVDELRRLAGRLASAPRDA